MNNNQFRRLLVDNPNGQDGSPMASKAGATPTTLGARKSSFMPMTPRTVKGGGDVDFARQVRERNAVLQPTKKFKSVAPKGVRYAAGYTDRAKARTEGEAGDEDDKAARIQALEEQMKLGQISMETFETLREQITGGDISSTHLVKGLDRKLLERVRRGEDVLGTGNEGDGAAADVDEELDRLAEKEVEAVEKQKAEKKKGSMAPPPPVAGVKRSRDEIMGELKAQRKAAAEAKAAPVLDSRWKKIGDPGKSRIEIDHKGREVLITVDEDGVVKKKVRKVARQQSEDDGRALDMPDESKPVLGSDTIVPELEKVPEPQPEDEDYDIFEGVGTEYDPLGESEDDDDTSSDEDESGRAKLSKSRIDDTKPSTSPTDDKSRPKPSSDAAPTKPRNYFNDTPSTAEETSQDRLAGVQGLLKKAARMDPVATEDDAEDLDDEKGARLKKRAQMLAQSDRDFDDMDMGFGSSRFDDGEDEGDGKVKLSEWKGGIEADEDGAKYTDKKPKRKPKKRKGDANNMADIMRVIDGRKAKDGK